MKRSQIKRKVGLKRTRLKPVSKSRAKENRAYTVKRKAFLERHPLCGACWPLFEEIPDISTEVHHKAGRNGKRLLDEKDWVAICRRCHSFIHANARAARVLGLLK